MSAYPSNNGRKNRKPGASGLRDDLCYEILSVSEDGLKCAVEVSDDVFDVLDADGETDGVPLDALIGELGVVALCVGRGCRVYDEIGRASCRERV